MAVSAGRPGGEVQPVEQLRHRLNDIDATDYDHRGLELPGLIADVHTTMAAGHRLAELLPMAVVMHAQTVKGWLGIAGAPVDLRWQAATLSREAAQESGNRTMLGVAAWGSVLELLGSGAFDLARDELDASAVPTETPEGMQLDGMLALTRSLVAAAGGRSAESAAALEHAAELAERTGQRNAFRMGFGPVNVGIWRMSALLEADEPDIAIRVAEGLRPSEHHSRERQAAYWMDYGRALARVRRRDDAVRALRRGEVLFPMRVLRNPFVRDVLAELTAHAKRDAVGRELRGMAYRAGLPV